MAEAFARMVSRALPRPAWLGEDAPQSDVVLSTRTRVMRNLQGTRFPSSASVPELQAVLAHVGRAAAPLNLSINKSLTESERGALVASRLVSPDFPWHEPARALLMDDRRKLSLMINEEDHLRVQALTAGWSAMASDAEAYACVDVLERQLHWAWSPTYGYLAASPYNAGEGVRQSCMVHLVGLAHARRLPAVIKALAEHGITIRGLFGENSRAIGAFVQVSILRRALGDFIGAIDYLIREERSARGSVASGELVERVQKALDFVASSRMLSLADTLRVLAWIRWGALAGVTTVKISPRDVDHLWTQLDIGGGGDSGGAERADLLRSQLGV